MTNRIHFRMNQKTYWKGKVLCLGAMLVAQAAGINTMPVSAPQHLTKVGKTIEEVDPNVIISCLDSELEDASQVPQYLDKLQEAADAGKTVIHFADQFPGKQRNQCELGPLNWYDGRGNLSFATNNPKVAELVKDWSDGEDRFTPPKCIEDVNTVYATKEFEALIKDIQQCKAIDQARTAFAAEEAAEEAQEAEEEFFDLIEEDEDIGGGDEEAWIQEQEMLEEIPLPGQPLDEKARKKE